MTKLEAGIQKLISKVDEYARTDDERRTVVVKEDLVKAIQNTYTNSLAEMKDYGDPDGFIITVEQTLLSLIQHYINQIEGEWS
tara:strand:+ start:2121 stop:2369 length:249 start_codon:yes stop_codon:yes gene_type:complete